MNIEHTHYRGNILTYAKNPVTPGSCGILAIINGAFAPFIYVPLSSHSGRLLKESIESYSLINTGSGIVIIILSLIGFWVLVKKKYILSSIPLALSAVIIIIEVYKVAIEGVPGDMRTLLHDPTMSPLPYFRGPLVSYDMVVRGRFGTALGYLVGGHISFFFAVLMGRSQIAKEKNKSKLHIFLGSVLLMAAISVLLYFLIVAGERPVIESHIKGFY